MSPESRAAWDLGTCYAIFSEAYARNVLPWGFSFLPAAAVYWQAIPKDYSAFLRKPISSAISTPLSSSPR